MKFNFDIKDNKHVVGWNRFVSEGLNEFDEARQSNTRWDFPKMSKHYGIYYMAFLNAAYISSDNDEEFCRFNGNVPIKFLEKLNDGKLYG